MLNYHFDKNHIKKFVDEYLTGKEKEVDDKIQLWKDILLKMKKKKR